MKARCEIDPDQMTIHIGRESYIVDVPDGDHDIKLRWFADAPVVCWFNFVGQRSVPVVSGERVDTTVRAKGLQTIELRTSKKTTVAALVSYRELSRSDVLDYTPVEVAAPPPAQLQLSNLVDQAVLRQLAAMGINAPHGLQVDEDDNLDDDDEEGDEFGSGYMDADDELVGAEDSDSGAGAGVPPPDPGAPLNAGQSSPDATGNDPTPRQQRPAE